MVYSFVCYIAPFEYEVFPVVRKSSNITRISQLHGKKFCHPGYGFETEWTKVISQVCILNLQFPQNMLFKFECI